jgi:molybdate/tungstate transport system substrate-binding protein
MKNYKIVIPLLFISTILIPEYTDWYVNFARNEMSIAYTQNSAMYDKINQDY